MQITDVKIRKTFDMGDIKAIVSVTLDDCIAIHDIRIVEGPGRLFAAIPSRKDKNEIYRDIVHPISQEARRKFEDIILKAYENYIKLFTQPRT